MESSYAAYTILRDTGRSYIILFLEKITHTKVAEL
jgi:hypothetical protein